MAEADDFRARMELLADAVGNLSELARKSGLSRRVIDKYRNGESDPSRVRLVALAKAGGVRIEWLADGTGPMRDEAGAITPNQIDDAGNEMLLEAAIASAMQWTVTRKINQSPERFAALCLSLYRMLRRNAPASLPPAAELTQMSMRILDDMGPILGVKPGS